MKILGIDPGFGRMGFGCIEVDGNEFNAIDYGVITTASTDTQAKRLYDIAQDIDYLLKTHTPDLVAIEQLFFKQNITTGIRVAEAKGVVLMHCAKYSISVVDFTPAQIKKSLTGDGKADKAAMKFMVTQLLQLGKSPKIDDAADALGIAIVAASARIES